MLVTFQHISLKKQCGKWVEAVNTSADPAAKKEDRETRAQREDEAKGLDEGTEGLGARDKTSGYIKSDEISSCRKFSCIPTPKSLTPHLLVI